jgi:hypothetical protein
MRGITDMEALCTILRLSTRRSMRFDDRKTVLFLASDDAQYISSEQIVVDAALTVSVISKAPHEMRG